LFGLFSGVSTGRQYTLGQLRCDKYLHVRHGLKDDNMRVLMVSSKPVTREEYDDWVDT
jgi:hypothetical protein